MVRGTEEQSELWELLFTPVLEAVGGAILSRSTWISGSRILLLEEHA